MVGVEALIRWDHPERGMDGPGIHRPCRGDRPDLTDRPMGDDTACVQNRALQDAGLPILSVAVNISPQQSVRRRSVKAVAARWAKRAGAASLELELTESTVMHAGER